MHRRSSGEQRSQVSKKQSASEFKCLKEVKCAAGLTDKYLIGHFLFVQFLFFRADDCFYLFSYLRDFQFLDMTT